ncbi:MAG TPA: response regulator transcription factor [Verrucomicrobiae bacterium]
MAKILIIDDDQQICRLVGQFLRMQKHEITTATDGEQGLKLAAEVVPDLILCDLEMPELDGQGVVAALRQDARLGEIPVIFLSGCTDRSQIRKSMNLGGDDFITKPARLPEILEAVNARLNRRQKQLQQLDQQLETAVQIFVGIIHDLNQTGPEVRWLLDTNIEMADKQNQIIQRVRESLDAGRSNPEPPPAAPAPASLLIKSHNRQQFLKLSEVKALMAYGEYSNVYWGKDQHILFRKPLKQWELELPPEQFVRVHRQAIVNLAYLDFVEKDAAGKPQIHLRDFKEVIPVSQRETPNFNRCLKNFQSR